MANEVQVFEMIGVRGSREARPVTFREKQTISIGGAASAAFDASTSFVTIISNTSCLVEFGTAPDGLGDTFPIVAGQLYDFEAKHLQKVIAVAGTATAPTVSIASGGATGTEYTEDAVAAANPVGAMGMGVAITTPANEVPDADNVAQRFTRKGEAHTKNVDLEAKLPASLGPQSSPNSLSAVNSSLTGAQLLATGSVTAVGTSALSITVAAGTQVVRFYNISGVIIYLNDTGTAVADTGGSIPIPAQASGVAGYWSSEPGWSGTLSIIAASGSGNKFTCVGYS